MSELTAEETACCPICESKIWRSRKPLHLYGYRVCRRCRYRLVSRRQVAFFLDVFIVAACTEVATFGVWYLLEKPTAIAWISSIVARGLGTVLFGLKDGFRGQSAGKWVCGLQVVSIDTHTPISFGPSFLRNLPIVGLWLAGFVLGLAFFPAAALINLALLIVLLCMNWQLYRGPRWGDGLARTKVIQKAHAYRIPFDTRGLLCAHCGYNLRGNVSGVCPECGRPIPAVMPAEPAGT
jgi:uncharacterized RDD family membrane protein YckC